MIAAATPRQLAARSMLGSWLVFSMAPLSFLSIALFSSLKNRSGWPLFFGLVWRLAPVVAPAILGIILTVSNENKLKAGLLVDRWPEALLAEARDWLAQPHIHRLPLASALLFVAIACFSLLREHHGLGGLIPFSCIFITPAGTHARIRGMLAKPQPHQHFLDWSVLKPLHSDQWGDRT